MKINGPKNSKISLKSSMDSINKMFGTANNTFLSSTLIEHPDNFSTTEQPKLHTDSSPVDNHHSIAENDVLNFDPCLELCKTCLASKSKRNPKLMLTNITEWNVNPYLLCSFTENTMKALGSFKSNIMDIHCSPEFEKFTSFWITIISALTSA